MTSLIATTSMKDWISRGWTITSGHVHGLEGPSPFPPVATGDILSGWNPPPDALPGHFKLVGDKKDGEHVEDLLLAKQIEGDGGP